MAETLPKVRPWLMTVTVLFVLADVALGTYAALKRTRRQPPRQQVSARPVAYGPREQRWREDLEFFAQKFPSVQVDSAKLYPPAKFHDDVAKLEHDLPGLSDSEIVLRLMRLVATGRMAHTTVDPAGRLEFHSYPLKFFWYSDGPALTHAGEEYKSALGTRIVRIGSMTPEELESAVEPYLSHENTSLLHELSPDFMLNREVAEHFGLADKDGSVEFTFARPNAEQFRLRVAPISSDADEQLISVDAALHLSSPLSRKHPRDWYWYEYLADAHLLYIQYNRCRNNPKKSFKRFVQALFRFVDGRKISRKVDRVIVDLRFNTGGDSSVIDPLIEGFHKRSQLSDKGRLYVLIGRGTFSSGMMAAVRFRQDLDAILIGEGSGSPPNEYGEVKSFTLPNSRIQIEYTTKFFRLVKDSDPQTLEPDLSVQLSMADLLSGRDQVFETALKHRWPRDQLAAPR